MQRISDGLFSSTCRLIQASQHSSQARSWWPCCGDTLRELASERQMGQCFMVFGGRGCLVWLAWIVESIDRLSLEDEKEGIELV
jgi:hypothetical protein